jgi:periplasmic divalent cation tolerance protein
MSTHISLMAVVTTVASREQARQLARQMVAHKLAACAQISEIESVYTWKGEMVQEPEWRIVFKTTQARRPALQAALQSAHPYEVPAIVCMDLDSANAAYAEWVQENTQA